MLLLPNSKQMKNADHYTIETCGIPSLELMERAAQGCVNTLLENDVDCTNVLVVCGSGNNGGDGFAIARILKEKKHEVTVLFLGSALKATKDCKTQMERFSEIGGEMITEYQKNDYSVIIDAVFGVGLSRNIEGKYAEVINILNEVPGYKFAVDIPSGVSADSGQIFGVAFQADLTVTFQASKIGMNLYPGKSCCGMIKVYDIGINETQFTENTDVVITLEENELRRLLPVRNEDSNKGTFGKLLVIGGGFGMCGAAYFNAKSAYLAGAGLVRIYTPEINRVILQNKLPEAIISTYENYDEKQIEELLNWSDVICIGSGLGTSEISEKIVTYVLKHSEVPCVIDADAINVVAKKQGILKKLQEKQFIFTPHMKEMSRLTGKSILEICDNRFEISKNFVKDTKYVCVLKDSKTIIADAGERIVLNQTGNCALAKAGSGDILAGIIAGFISQKLSIKKAGVLGVYIHGLSGDQARLCKGKYSVLAEDVMEHISTAMKMLER